MCAQKRAPKEKQITTREIVKTLERIGVQEKDYAKAANMLLLAGVPREDYGRVLRLASTLEDLARGGFARTLGDLARGRIFTGEETKTAKGRISITYTHVVMSNEIFKDIIECAAGSAREKTGARQRAREFLDNMLDLNHLLKVGRITKEGWATGAQNFSESLIPKDNMSRVTWNLISTVLTPSVFWSSVLRPRREREEASRRTAVKYLVPSRKVVKRSPTAEELRKSRETFVIDLEPSPKKRHRKRRKKKRG